MNENNSTMSKKAAIAGMTISAIGSAEDINKQLIIAFVGTICFLTQAILDAKALKSKL